MPRTHDATSSAEVSKRLRLLTQTHAQAEIARRTGFPAANVHRFLNGGRVPAEFCGAVVREFGLNPAWLLTGEGTPHLSDVTAGTEEMAANVLELVEAMSAVARMRLGSLTGKHHLRVLRELNDALNDHERLRVRLNQHSRPVFEKLVADIEKALEKRDLERAGDLIKAAGQVARLCDDDVLALKLDAERAFHAFLNREFERSADFRRKVFIRQLAGGLNFDEQRQLDAQYFVMSLLGTGRIPEAHRVAKASLDLSMGDKGRFHAAMRATVGVLELDLGDLHSAMANIFAAMPEAAPLLLDQYAGYLNKMNLCAGLQTVRECMENGRPSRLKAIQLLRFANLLEDPALLKDVLDECVTDQPGTHPERAPDDLTDTIHAAALNEVLKSRGKPREANVMKRLKALPLKDGRDQAVGAIVRTQLLRRLGKRAKAESTLQEAQAVIDQLAPEVMLQLEYRALHARNQLELGVAEGQRFFDEHYARGYACFKPWVS